MTALSPAAMSSTTVVTWSVVVVTSSMMTMKTTTTTETVPLLKVPMTAGTESPKPAEDVSWTAGRPQKDYWSKRSCSRNRSAPFVEMMGYGLRLSAEISRTRLTSVLSNWTLCNGRNPMIERIDGGNGSEMCLMQLHHMPIGCVCDFNHGPLLPGGGGAKARNQVGEMRVRQLQSESGFCIGTGLRLS